MIEIKSLEMFYTLEEEHISVLSGVDLLISDGESISIVGPSGSGKTTLLLLLAGLEQPCGGGVYLDGVALSDLNADALADLRRDNIGFIFQSFHLVPSLTALGNVALALEIAGQADARERARQMLYQVGLEDREKHYPMQLSGGEQQRVAIARALVHSPKLVLADEPTGNLDVRTGEKVSDILFDLNSRNGSTLILATHDERIARRCNRLLHMNEGRLIEKRTNAISN